MELWLLSGVNDKHDCLFIHSHKQILPWARRSAAFWELGVGRVERATRCACAEKKRRRENRAGAHYPRGYSVCTLSSRYTKSKTPAASSGEQRRVELVFSHDVLVPVLVDRGVPDEHRGRLQVRADVQVWFVHGAEQRRAAVRGQGDAGQGAAGQRGEAHAQGQEVEADAARVAAAGYN